MFDSEHARYLNTIATDNKELPEKELEEIEKLVFDAATHGETAVRIDNVYKENRQKLKSCGYKVITKYTVLNGETVCLGTTISW